MIKITKIQIFLSHFILVVITLLLSFASFAQNPPLVFSQTPLGENFSCADNALTNAYKNLNYDINFLTLPSKRSLKEANSGNVDGEMLRAIGVEKRYPNLIHVPIVLCSVESVLLANKAVTINSLADLKNYRIGITTGYVDQENIARKYNLNVMRAAKDEILQIMLLRDRVDIIFSTEQKAHTLLQKYQDNEKYNIYKVKTLNRKIDLYHYIHKKHQAILPMLTEELKKLSQSGLIDTSQRTNQ